MRVLFKNRLLNLKIDRILQEYNDETFQHLVGVTLNGRRFHIVRDHDSRTWELISPKVFN